MIGHMSATPGKCNFIRDRYGPVGLTASSQVILPSTRSWRRRIKASKHDRIEVLKWFVGVGAKNCPVAVNAFTCTVISVNEIRR